MKKIIFSLLTVCVLGGAIAQNAKCGIDTKALVSEQLQAGATTIGFLAKMSPNFDRGRLEKAGIVIGAEAGQIVTLRVPVESLSELESNRGAAVQHSPPCRRPLDGQHAQRYAYR